MDYQNTDQGSSAKMWWIIGGLVVLAVAGWYFYGGKTTAPSAQAPTVSQSANTTAAIANELNAVPDVSAGLTADQAASAQTVSGF